MDATPEERWLPVAGYEDRYMVSDHGRIFSVRAGKYLRASMDRRHRHVSLWNHDGRKMHRVHRLVMAAFVGPCPVGMEVRHLDDNPDNNRLANLAYGSRSQNILDRVINGTHHYAKRTACKHGHEFTPENTLRTRSGSRRCRKCKRDRGREYMRRKRAG